MSALFDCILLTVVSVVLGQGEATPASHTTPQCHEPFDYPASESVLLRKSGGEGFEGAWRPAGFNARNPQAYRLVVGSIGPSASSGDKASVRTEASATEVVRFPFFDDSSRQMAFQPIKGIGRLLARPVEANETATWYVAAMILPERATDGVLFGGYVGFYLDGSGDNELFTGTGADDKPEYRLATRGGTGKVMSRRRAEIGRTDLLVVKAELRPGPDVFTLYVNPDTRAPEPKSDTVKRDLDVGGLDQLVLYSTGAFSLDDLPITGQFSELAGYPSPEELTSLRQPSGDSNVKQ